MVTKRENEKKQKYETLAADMAVNSDYRVSIVPVAVATLGTITNLRGHLTRTWLLDKDQITRAMGKGSPVLCCPTHQETNDCP